MDQQKWGVIYCPNTNSPKTKKRWEKILKSLRNKAVNFDYVQSDRKGSVERLASMLIENGYRTLVIVGGDSALCEAINAIMFSQVPSKEIKLGVIPNGIANDFAHYWGFEEKDYEKTIEWLKEARLRTIDVGKCSYKQMDTKHERYFINCINIGLAASIMNLKRKTRSFWGLNTLSYASSLFLLLFQRMEYRIRVKVNENDINHKIMTMCVGSCTGYGQTPNAVPYNGLLDVSLITTPGIMQLLEGIRLLFSRRFITYSKLDIFRSRSVIIENTGKAMIALDGQVLNDYKLISLLNVSIEQEAINFIIPN